LTRRGLGLLAAPLAALNGGCLALGQVARLPGQEHPQAAHRGGLRDRPSGAAQFPVLPPQPAHFGVPLRDAPTTRPMWDAALEAPAGVTDVKLSRVQFENANDAFDFS
jgi:hypothetical protein